MKMIAWLLLLPLSVHGAELPDLGEASRQIFSERQEIAIATEIMRDVRRDPRYLEDPEVTWYLRNLGQKLVAASPDPSRRLTFFLVDDPSVNAFALPGGFIGVHSGLMLAAQTESELAGVLAHEIAHITQQHLSRMIAADSQSTLLTLAALAVALLAARSNPQAAQAAIVGSQALAVQNRLDYSRDHEREADRVGFVMLADAGFEARGMADFFQRLLNVNRLYESNAPAYLYTHPLTTERIADMANRVVASRYKQVPDSLDFQLARARLKPLQATRQEIEGMSEALLQERYGSEAAARYTLVRALMEHGDLVRARVEMETLRLRAPSHPMLWKLAAELAERGGQREDAQQLLARGRGDFPNDVPLAIAHIDTLLRAREARAALEIAEHMLRIFPNYVPTLRAKARAHAQLDQPFEVHATEAEVLIALGEYDAAMEQLRLAQREGGADFYRSSAVEARSREIRQLRDDLDAAPGGASQPRLATAHPSP